MKRTSSLKKSSPIRRQNQEGSWAVSYGDMITLLLGFYIIYFSMEPPSRKSAALSESLMATLEKLDSTVSVKENLPGSSAQTGLPANENSKELSKTADQADGKIHKAKTASSSEKKSVGDRILEIFFPVQTADSVTPKEMPAKSIKGITSKVESPTQKTISSEIGKDGTPNGSEASRPQASGYRPELTEIKALDASATKIGERIYIMFPKISFFGSASTDISFEGKKVLEKFAQVYVPYAGKSVVNIVGYADERRIGGKYRFRDNLELSALRAVSAQRVLESSGIPLNRTRLMGHGVKEKLLDAEVASSDKEHWALSRKIMLVIEPEGE